MNDTRFDDRDRATDERWRDRLAGRPQPRFRDRLIGFLSVQPDVRVEVGFYDDIDLARFVARMLEYDR